MSRLRWWPWRVVLPSLVLASCSPLPPGPEGLAIKVGTLIDGTGAPPIQDGLILTKGDRIEYAGPASGATPPPGYTFVSLPEKTAMPGLINAHVHLFFNSVCSPDAPVSISQFILNVKVTLAEGVTTAADLASPLKAGAGLKRWLQRRPGSGPRVLTAGPFLTAPGSYPFDWMPEEYAHLEGAIGLTSPEHAKQTVSRLARGGVNFIKIGIVSKSFNGRPIPSVSDEIVRAVAAEAHARQLNVLTHAIYSQDWDRAVRLPIDALVHNSLEPVSNDTLRAAAERALPVAPTLLVWNAPLERALEPGFLDQPWVRERLDPALLPGLFDFKRSVESSSEEIPWTVPGVTRALVERQGRDSIDNLRRLHEAGAVIGVGTDAAVCFNQHGSLVWEMERMAQAGMGRSELLTAATQGSARVLGIEDTLGTLEPGKTADLIVLDSNPLEDLQNLRKVHLIVKDGRLLQPPALNATLWERLTFAWSLRRVLVDLLLG